LSPKRREIKKKSDLIFIIMLLLTLIIAALTHNVLTAIHDVIIIGAGTSGISAAKVLN
jgi:ribulose 1,5-bisphosphate synthetase/thiazole synthase